jgi:hypothetical protein
LSDLDFSSEDSARAGAAHNSEEETAGGVHRTLISELVLNTHQASDFLFRQFILDDVPVVVAQLGWVDQSGLCQLVYV